MRPEDHPAFYDFGGDEQRMKWSAVYALWAIAAELHQMNGGVTDD